MTDASGVVAMEAYARAICEQTSECVVPPVAPAWFLITYFLTIFTMLSGMMIATSIRQINWPSLVYVWAGFGCGLWIFFFPEVWGLMAILIGSVRHVYNLPLSHEIAFHLFLAAT